MEKILKIGELGFMGIAIETDYGLNTNQTTITILLHFVHIIYIYVCDIGYLYVCINLFYFPF